MPSVFSFSRTGASPVLTLNLYLLALTEQKFLLINFQRSVDKSSVTCVKWFPNSENLILSAHICGFMYTYDISQSCSELPPTYQVSQVE